MRADAAKATGTSARAEGSATKAAGNSAHAEGSSTDANATAAHAEGTSTRAHATNSHAEGVNTYVTGTSAHAEGNLSQASGNAAHAEGWNGVASGDFAHIQGESCTATAQSSHAEGANCTASGTNSHAEGQYAIASRFGQHAKASGQFAAAGDAQTSTFVARRVTTDATPDTLTFNGSASVALTGAAANVLTIPINRAHQFRVSVVARRHDVSGDTAAWEFKGHIARGSSGDAAFVGTVDDRAWAATGAAAWDVTLTINTADATNNYLVITVTGEAAKTIRWVATIDTTEVG